MNILCTFRISVSWVWYTYTIFMSKKMFVLQRCMRHQSYLTPLATLDTFKISNSYYTQISRTRQSVQDDFSSAVVKMVSIFFSSLYFTQSFFQLPENCPKGTNYDS